jgi:hypothetical protein
MHERDGAGDSSTAEGVLYNEAGNRIGDAAQMELEPLVRFARDQPFKTLILALGIGYLTAKVL